MSTKARSYLRIDQRKQSSGTSIISPAKAVRKWSWVRANHWGEYGGLPDKYKNQINSMGGFGSWYRNLGGWTTMQNGAIHWKVFDDSTIPAVYGTKPLKPTAETIDAARKSLVATQRFGKDALKISAIDGFMPSSSGGRGPSDGIDPMDMGSAELVGGMRRRRPSFGELAINPSGAQVQVA